MFECTLCGAIFETCFEFISTRNYDLCETYNECPHCHGEVVRYKEEDISDED